MATWHTHYNDPNGDIILISNDQIKFSTTSSILGKSSTVFEAMKSLPSPSSGTRAAASAIDLDYPADLIECFLDFVSVADPKLPILPLQQCRAFLTFAELFDCSTLMPPLRVHLCEVVGTPEDCANLLLMASDRDDWAMGRAALGRMDGSVIIWIRRNRGGFKIYFDRLRLQWRQRLMELLFLPALQENVHIACIAWSKVAPDFKPPTDDVGEATSESIGNQAGSVGWHG